jgi:hypothetical protein
MKPWTGLLFCLVSICVSLPLVAQDSITFGNTDGTFTGSGLNSGDLSLGNSTLTSISGFTGNLAGYNTSNLAGLGTLSFSSGPLMSGTMVPLANQVSTFGPGGTFNVADTFNGGYGGFTFSGTFSGASWSCAAGVNCHLVSGTTNEWKGKWVFQGSLAMGSTLTIDGQKFTATSPGTIQLTAAGPGNGLETVTLNKDGSINFNDAGGITNFGGKFQIAPEPGTLILFGSGLIVMGRLIKRKRARDLTGSISFDS